MKVVNNWLKLSALSVILVGLTAFVAVAETTDQFLSAEEREVFAILDQAIFVAEMQECGTIRFDGTKEGAAQCNGECPNQDQKCMPGIRYRPLPRNDFTWRSTCQCMDKEERKCGKKFALGYYGGEAGDSCGLGECEDGETCQAVTISSLNGPEVSCECKKSN